MTKMKFGLTAAGGGEVGGTVGGTVVTGGGGGGVGGSGSSAVPLSSSRDSSRSIKTDPVLVRDPARAVASRREAVDLPKPEPEPFLSV